MSKHKGDKIMSDLIKVGDTVQVDWGSDRLLIGVVLSVPQQSGEAWIIETKSEIHYVQCFDDIWKRK